VIGYPAFSIYNNAQDQQRIFQGVFDIKRMQPGTSGTSEGGTILHDATTLGGNSGSLVLDLETGKAMALHFGGYEGKTNYAVTAPVVRRLLRDKLGIEVA
jgi:endonuclease G